MIKTILFDVDGVLSDFSHSFTNLAHQLFGAPVRGAINQETWDFGYTQEQKKELWNIVKASPSFWLECVPLVDNLTWVRIDALSLHHRVYFVTSRVGDTAKRQTERWLRGWGVMIPTVIIVPPLCNKEGIARELGVTHSLEDKLENAIGIRYGARARSYLLDRPYNRTVDDPEVTRITSVNQFIEEVEHG